MSFLSSLYSANFWRDTTFADGAVLKVGHVVGANRRIMGHLYAYDRGDGLQRVFDLRSIPGMAEAMSGCIPLNMQLRKLIELLTERFKSAREFEASLPRQVTLLATPA